MYYLLIIFQDAQEFLRCFMDQLHEELKEPIVEIAPTLKINADRHDTLDCIRADSGILASEDSSHSDADYETCDSGLSSEKTSCVDEGVESQETLFEPTDLTGDTSTHPSLNSSKIFHDSNPSIQCSTLSNHGDDTNSRDSLSLTKNGSTDNCLNINCCDSSIMPKEDKLSKDREGSVITKSESLHNVNEENIHLNNLLSSNKASCISQLKQGTPETIMSILNARKQNIQYRSIVSDIFDGKLLSSVQCLTCDTVRYFYILNLNQLTCHL